MCLMLTFPSMETNTFIDAISCQAAKDDCHHKCSNLDVVVCLKNLIDQVKILGIISCSHGI